MWVDGLPVGFMDGLMDGYVDLYWIAGFELWIIYGIEGLDRELK